jgi:hypothetical protein
LDRALAAVGLDLKNVLAQRLGTHPKIGRDGRDRALALKGQTNASLDLLWRMLLRALP